MQNIYLIRHGEKNLTPPDPGLTLKGFQQAVNTGVYFKNLNDFCIISSPLARTIQTATKIAEQLNSNFTAERLLRERINFGDDPNQTKEEFIKDWRLTTKDRRYVPSVGESSEQTGERMYKYISSLPHTPKNIILVTHGGAIADYLRTSFGDAVIFPKLFNHEKQRKFHVPHCAINHLLRDGKKIKIKKINFVDHLL